MLSDDSTTSSDYQQSSPSSHSQPRTIRPTHRHKRLPSSFTFATDIALPTLPEYESLDRSQSSSKSLSAWDGDDMPPPPGYPGSLSSTGGDDDPDDADAEEDEVKDLVLDPPVFRSTRKIRRQRSVSGGAAVAASEDRLDSLLERSILALEASNALLQSSLVTRNSLNHVLADSSFDRSMDAQIRFLSRRFASDEEREMELDRVLEGVDGLVNNSLGILNEAQPPYQDVVSRSLPVESSMGARSSMPYSTTHQPAITVPQSQQPRLRLSADGTRPRSPPPRPFTQYVSIESEHGFAAEATATQEAIYLPSTSGVRSSPKNTSFSPQPQLSAPSTPSHRTQVHHQESRSTPRSPLAHAMLQRIASNSSAATSRSASPEAILSFFSHLPKSPNKLFASSLQGVAGNEERGRMSATSATRTVFDTGLASSGTWPKGAEQATTPARPTHRPYAASMSSMPGGSSLTGRDQVGKPDPSQFAITASLRKILEEAEKRNVRPTSEVGAGKQRAEGERPAGEVEPSRRSRSASVGRRGHLRPTALSVISTPSASEAIVYRGEKSSTDRILDLPTPYRLKPPEEPSSEFTPTHTPRSSISGTSTPRRSALKGASGRSTPNSSGHPSPLVVSFSPLPPKHETDGTFSRAREKSKVKGRSKEKEREEKAPWWTEWLLGPPPGSLSCPYAPPPTHAKSMTREEGRWAGGVDSWQM